MIAEFLILSFGLVLLLAGAEALVKGSSSIALRLGLSPLVIGLTVVAFGTSAPELLVSAVASLNQQGDIAMGNVVGSNIINIAIILGFAAFIYPININTSVIKFDMPLLIFVTFVLVLALMYGTITTLMGIILFSGLIIYISINVVNAKKEIDETVKDEFTEGVPNKSKSLIIDILFVLGGLGLLVFGSRLMVNSATDIAKILHVSDAIIGLTIVSLGTSLPELATSVIAALKKQPDIAIGNVVGSNIFNILGILGIASILNPISAPGLTEIDYWTMFIYSIFLLPLMITGKKLTRWEGALLLTGYGLYLYLIWPK